MRKLNMWHRAGLVLSLLWVVGAGTWQRNTDLQQAHDFSFTTYEDCKDKPLPELAPGARTVIDQCGTDVQRAYDFVMMNSWSRVADFAITPILLGWLIAYLALWIGKWVLAGRKSSS